ncbi:MAG TPA: DUF2252 domain-containing protein [Conexibacter sp.]|nr:DUF2252 domain-containing protein [Conexibacter sp.]
MSVADRVGDGKRARAAAPRSGHGAWAPAPDRPDPIALLEEQAESRVPELVPIRHGRMAASPFAFFRGAAAIMAADLAETPVSGLRVQLCGDAHLANFGGFASPERDLVFDLNDFDETLPGPWEWDLKRLAASIAIAARERGDEEAARHEAVRGTVRAYREAMRGFAQLSALEVWYARVDAAALEALADAQLTKAQRARVGRTVEKARRKDHLRAFAKLVREDGGEPRFVSDPPLLVPIAELVPADEADRLHAGMRALLDDYRATLPEERRALIDRYRYVDLARKVVGVGSVGTRAWVVLMLGPAGEPLFLQCKEAQASVLERHAGASGHGNHGERVVQGQRLMQAASDILLGWLRSPGMDGVARDFYVRQLWDWKASADVETMEPSGLAAYAQPCAWTLARAHARSGDPAAIAGYVGRGEALDRALADFAEAYADQTERDHAALLAAIESGRVEARTGV